MEAKSILLWNCATYRYFHQQQFGVCPLRIIWCKLHRTYLGTFHLISPNYGRNNNVDLIRELQKETLSFLQKGDISVRVTRCKILDVLLFLYCSQIIIFFSKITQPHPLKSYGSLQLTDMRIVYKVIV